MTLDDFPQALFRCLITANSEDAVSKVVEAEEPSMRWEPLGGNQNNFGVIENQQASPVAALIEKVTNCIDAILMRRCLEEGIDPKSSVAPRTMAEAVEQFFISTHKSWHLGPVRREQAESIQIVASGSTKHPSLLVYDDGEGQHPDDFESTFLSLLRGNKNEIAFVQGKYNMGGTGAIVFCGKHRYHLIGSKRFDGSGDFGFTLIRKHPLTEEEAKSKRSTWYEYLKIDGRIPRFPITELDLGLANRKFTTGTIIKLYDYDLPAGTRGALPQEPRRAIDQFLFEPALPIYLVDTAERYPRNKVLQIDCFGLKHRLEREENKYVERKFSVQDPGDLKVSILQYRHNDQEGGTAPGPVDDPDKLIDIRKSSPNEGTIKVGLGATEQLKVGNEIEISAALGGPKDLECRFWLKVVAPQPKQKEVKKEELKEELPGLPGYVLAYKDDPNTPNSTTWEKLGEANVAMDFDDVMHPLLSGDGNLEKIFINMDSRVLRNYFSKQSSLSVESKELAEKKYISSVYFHTIFLFSITKNRKYELKQGDRPVDVGDYLKDVFNSYYADFLLNFGSEQLMVSLAD